MKAHTASLFLSLLLAAQTLSLWHMAEFGFEEHDHQGHACLVCTYHQQSTEDLAFPVHGIEINHSAQHRSYFDLDTRVVAISYLAALSRGPPSLS